MKGVAFTEKSSGAGGALDIGIDSASKYHRFFLELFSCQNATKKAKTACRTYYQLMPKLPDTVWSGQRKRPTIAGHLRWCERGLADSVLFPVVLGKNRSKLPSSLRS